jgi:hypothetical protein
VVGIGAAPLRGRQVRRRGGEGPRAIDERPDQPYLYFNTACCESLAGQVAEAIEHLRQAIDMWDGCREMAKHDSDFDTIRDEPAFQARLG